MGWPQYGRSGTTGTPPKLGWNMVGVMSTKTCNISETVQDGTKVTNLLWVIGSRIRAFDWYQRPKSMTLDDFKQPKRTLAEKNRFTEPTEKSEWSRPLRSAAKYRALSLVSRNIRFLRIFAVDGPGLQTFASTFPTLKLTLLYSNICRRQLFSQCRIKTLEAQVHSEKWGSLSKFWNS